MFIFLDGRSTRLCSDPPLFGNSRMRGHLFDYFGHLVDSDLTASMVYMEWYYSVQKKRRVVGPIIGPCQ